MALYGNYTFLLPMQTGHILGVLPNRRINANIGHGDCLNKNSILQNKMPYFYLWTRRKHYYLKGGKRTVGSSAVGNTQEGVRYCEDCNDYAMRPIFPSDFGSLQIMQQTKKYNSIGANISLVSCGKYIYTIAMVKIIFIATDSSMLVRLIHA